MNASIKNLILFVGGMVVGAIATKITTDYYTNKKTNWDDYGDVEYKTPLDVDIAEETAPIKKDFSEDMIDINNELNQDTDLEEMEDLMDSSVLIRDDAPVIVPPYNISPEEFEQEGFDPEEWILYADGYVTDSYGTPVDNDAVLESLGPDFKHYFGTYADDEIWIRNTGLQIDYSVIRDLDNFRDVAPAKVKNAMGIK